MFSVSKSKATLIEKGKENIDRIVFQNCGDLGCSIMLYANPSSLISLSILD